MSQQPSSPGAAGPPARKRPAPSAAGPPETPSPGEYLRILVVAALLGVPVALAAAAFMSATHGLTTLVWTTVPDNAGWTTPPGWYVLAVPAMAGLLVAAVPSAALGSVLLPGLLASGTAALVFTGVDHWPGIAETVLRLPPLPDYPTVRLVDVAWCLLVALVAAVVAAGARGIAREVAERTARISPVVLLCGAGLVVGLLAVGFRAVTSQPVDLTPAVIASVIGWLVATAMGRREARH